MSLLNANEYKISDSRENAALSVLITPRNWVHPIFAATFVTRSRSLLAWWGRHRRGLAGNVATVEPVVRPQKLTTSGRPSFSQAVKLEGLQQVVGHGGGKLGAMVRSFMARAGLPSAGVIPVQRF